MFEKWLNAGPEELGMIVLSAVLVYIAVIVCTRLAGLRSFSKLSSFDFAITVAIGSIIATIITTKKPPVLQGVVALGTVYFLQKALSFMRRFGWVSTLVDNRPTLLMRQGQILDKNMRKTGVTEADLRAKLRESNVLERSQVRAVVFETTGDISVLHSKDDAVDLEPWLTEGVEDAADPE